MDLWALLGAVGSIASLVGLMLPLQTKRQRLIHVAYGLSIALFAATAMWYWQANQRIRKVELAATRLLSGEEYDYTVDGFNQAALAFLEKNRDLYPDSYARAVEICKQNDCLGPQYGKLGGSDIAHEYNQRNVRYALKGLIRGISKLEGGT